MWVNNYSTQPETANTHLVDLCHALVMNYLDFFYLKIVNINQNDKLRIIEQCSSPNHRISNS